MKIAIIGYAGQGKAAYEYWKDGNAITVCDRDQSLELPSDVKRQLGEGYLQNLHEYDLLIRTPALHPRDIADANPEHPEVMTKVTSVTNEFFKVCPSRNIIGVTGTKGKGTTSTLISKILEAASKRVHLGGNIGIPPLDMLKNDIQPDDWVVLELANFQLIDLRHSPPIAVCLMVEPEHLDWHTDVTEYVGAKQQLFVHQKASDIAVFYQANERSAEVVSVSDAKKIPYMEPPGAYVKDGIVTIDGHELCKTSELKLLGEHNWQNVCAAVTAVWQITQDTDAISSALKNFSGLPYRIELRKERDGIRYFNDSFATAPGATIAAVKAIPGSKVMIVGGFDRGLDLTELATTISNNAYDIKHVVLIGESADRLAEVLNKVGFKDYSHCREKDMKSIVAVAEEHAEPGDAVVLSPSFASFDMFKNFEDRGDKFNEAIA